MKWVWLRCTIAVSHTHWIILNHNLSLKIVFLSRVFWFYSCKQIEQLTFNTFTNFEDDVMTLKVSIKCLLYFLESIFFNANCFWTGKNFGRIMFILISLHFLLKYLSYFFHSLLKFAIHSTVNRKTTFK